MDEKIGAGHAFNKPATPPRKKLACGRRNEQGNGNGHSTVVKYWSSWNIEDGKPRLSDIGGMDEFRTELATQTVSLVRGLPSGAGGLHDLWVAVISTISLSLHRVTQLLLEGMA